MSHSEISLDQALSLIEQAWEELRRSPFVQRQLGLAPAGLPESIQATIELIPS